MDRKPAFLTPPKPSRKRIPSRFFPVVMLLAGLLLSPLQPPRAAAQLEPAHAFNPPIDRAAQPIPAPRPNDGVGQVKIEPSTVIIDEFESEASIAAWYTSQNGTASGDFGVAAAGYNGQGSVLTYSLGSPYAYIGVTKPLTEPLTAYGVELWFKTTANIDLLVGVVVGETYVNPQPIRPFHAWDSDAWYRYRLLFPEPGDISSIAIQARLNSQYSTAAGALWVDSIVAFTEPIEYDLAASSRQVGSTLADMSNFQDILGTHNPDLNYPDERALDLALDVGMHYMGSGAVRWHYLEQKKKVFNFAAADAAVAANQARGFTTIFGVAGGNPIYTGAWDNPPLTEDELDVFGRYIDAVAARYAGQNLVYDIWGEPVHPVLWTLSPAQFTAIIKTASERIRAVDPSATIISGGLLEFDTGYLQGMIDAGFANYVDGFGVHCYYIRDPENLSRYAHHIRSYLKEHGGIDLPIWDTEWGYSSAALGSETAEQALQKHGRIVARQLLSAWANDLSSVMYYSYLDTGEGYVGDMGLLEIDYDPKPAFQAAKTIHQFTANKKLVGSLSALPVNYYGLKLENDQGVSFALWSADKLTSLKVILPPSASAIDYLGSPVAADAFNSFLLSDQNSPVFITCPSCAPTVTKTYLPIILGGQ